MKHTIDDNIDTMKICNIDLMNNKYKYSEETLEKNISQLNKKIILQTQTLSAKFCLKYIYCIDDIDDGDEESYIFDINYILECQPHIDELQLRSLMKIA